MAMVERINTLKECQFGGTDRCPGSLSLNGCPNNTIVFCTVSQVNTGAVDYDWDGKAIIGRPAIEEKGAIVEQPSLKPVTAI